MTVLWAVVILRSCHHLGFEAGRNWALPHKGDLRRYLADGLPEHASDLLGNAA